MLDYNFNITTPRLTLSYLDPANELHCSFVHELTNSPEVRYIYRTVSPVPPSREEIVSRLEKGANSLETEGYGRYLISRQPGDSVKPTEVKRVPFSEAVNSHELIGCVSLQCARFPSAPTVPDLGFAIMAEHYGKGYAMEAAQGLIKYYREEKGRTAFAGYTSTDNEKSMTLFRRLGFELRAVKPVRGIFEGPAADLPVAIWTLGVGELEEYGL